MDVIDVLDGAVVVVVAVVWAVVVVVCIMVGVVVVGGLPRFLVDWVE